MKNRRPPRLVPTPLRLAALSAAVLALSPGITRTARAQASTSQPAPADTTQTAATQTATTTAPDQHAKLTLDPTAAVTAPDLSGLSLEDLMNIEVTSVSRQRQRIGDAAAAVYVITQDDIHRSGMNSIPELLRLSPGIHVGQNDAGVWTVGSRGMDSVRTDNLLVLMDGRTVYTPLFAGVYWDMVDYILDDLDRIEVIRGPGATLWGSNAVNGVINITTKSAKDTQGALIQDYTGTDGYIGSVRYGGNIDNHIYYRVYAKYRTMDNLPDPGNPNVIDGWDSQREGFRIDADLSPSDLLTVQSDVFFNRAGTTRNHLSFTPPLSTETSVISNTSGGNLLARYTHTFSEQSDFSVQAYYDNFSLFDFNNDFHQHTFDIEFQHRFPIANSHEVIWGGEYRLVEDSIDAKSVLGPEGDFSDPSGRNNSLVSGFIQDDMTLIPKRLHAIVGTKLEMTPFTGFEFEPSGRLLYTPDEHNTLWAAISRATRSPSRSENDSHVVATVVPGQGLPVAIDFNGNPNLRSEQLLALESGYRVEPVSNLMLGISTFWNFHHGIEEGRPSGPPVPVINPTDPHVDQPFTYVNAADGESYGAEAEARWKISDQLQLSGSYSYLGVNLRSTIPGELPNTTDNINRASPAHQGQVHVYYDITRDLQFNAATYVATAAQSGAIPPLFRTDLNVIWHPEKHLEFSAGVRNLFDNRHPESFDQALRSTDNEVPRSFFLTLTARF